MVRKLRDLFGREFHVDAAFARQLAVKYRGVKPDLQHLLALDAHVSAPWLAAFAGRSSRAQDAVARLRAAEASGLLHIPIAELAESYVHMHLNRLFRAEQWAHESVIYDFLSCLYEARVARDHASDTQPA